MAEISHGTSTHGSQIFSPYKAVGFLSNHVPCVYHILGADHFLLTAVGRSFHIYNCEKLALRIVGKPLPNDVNVICLSRNTEVAVAAGSDIYIFLKGKLIATYSEHKAKVSIVIKLADHLISIDDENEVRVWCNKTYETYLDFKLDQDSFTITTCIHPVTYLNKILFGSKQGKMELWNIRTNTLIHKFNGWEEPIVALEQAPAVDVVAVGLRSGHIILYNIKFEKKLMSFHQELGIISAISFRTDGKPVMATASTTGHISFWDLEKKRNISVMRNAHNESVTGLKFFYKQPLLITTGPDNAIKLWIFDNPDGSARLLKSRCGHSLPPTRTLFYGPAGNILLSSGMDNSLRASRIFLGDIYEFTQGHIIKKSRRTGTLVEDLKIPPITCMATELARANEWDNIVTCHMGVPKAFTWSMSKKALGQFRLDGGRNTTSTACDISSCGNFTVIGYSNGTIKKFNLQSGLDRGIFGNEKSHHTGTVRGVSIDNTNSIVVSTSADKFIKFWKFTSMKMYQSIKCEYAIAQSKLHRESSLLAISFDNFQIQLYDIDTRTVVRKFFGHGSVITDICWSSDARWLISSSLDGTIKTWDVPSARLVDCFAVEEPATSVSFSPIRDMLVTTHQDNLGIYMWSNKVMFSGINPSPLPEDYEPFIVTLPRTKDIEINSDDEDENEDNDERYMREKEYVSPEQISEDLVTLSMLPESRWRNLINLDLIKLRNKPKEPPKKPKAAPFFLPTIAGVETKFDLTKTDVEKDDNKNRIIARTSFETHSPIVQYMATDDIKKCNLLQFLKTLGPSELEVEFRMLSPDLGGSVDSLCDLMKCFVVLLKSGKDYELVQGYVSLFLKLHGDLIPHHEKMRKTSEELLRTIDNSWKQCEEFLYQTTCLIKYFKSATV